VAEEQSRARSDRAPAPAAEAKRSAKRRAPAPERSIVPACSGREEGRGVGLDACVRLLLEEERKEMKRWLRAGRFVL
jgi:hypothetical protein